MEKSIFDTGFLFAYFDEKDTFHFECSGLMPIELPNALLPDVVLPELAYLILREICA